MRQVDINQGRCKNCDFFVTKIEWTEGMNQYAIFQRAIYHWSVYNRTKMMAGTDETDEIALMKQKSLSFNIEIQYFNSNLSVRIVLARQASHMQCVFG